MGTDYVEFDVQLTSDRKAVVYHDFELMVNINEDLTGGEEPIQIGVHQLPLAVARRIRVDPVHKNEPQVINTPRLKLLIEKHMDAILALSAFESMGEHLDHLGSGVCESNVTVRRLVKRLAKRRNAKKLQRTRWMHVVEQVPTLVELFKFVPLNVGFNIEIKYPVENVGVFFLFVFTPFIYLAIALCVLIPYL